MFWNKHRNRMAELEERITELEKDHNQLDNFVMTQQQIVNARLRELIQKLRGEKKMPKSTKKKKK